MEIYHGKRTLAIDVSNKEREIVKIKDIIDNKEFEEEEFKLAIAFGRKVTGEIVFEDIEKMPHLLIAGATGTGKSICIHNIIVNILYKAKPSEVKFLFIDPRKVELTKYNGIPHLLIPVVTEQIKAAGALAWTVCEMEDRYRKFGAINVRNIDEYNKYVEEENEFARLPRIVIIIDEFSDIMMNYAKEIEESICRLAQKARAAGIHLIIATQRPIVNVITGLIKANFTTRIAFSVSSKVDSITILDQSGAEELLGNGDMLFYKRGVQKPIRIQGAFISEEEIKKIVDFLKNNEKIIYNEDIIEIIEKGKENKLKTYIENEDEDIDPRLNEGIELVLEYREASASFIQRKMKVGYARAGRIIDQMAERGIISGYQGSKPREVLMTKERWNELKDLEKKC